MKSLETRIARLEQVVRPKDVIVVIHDASSHDKELYGYGGHGQHFIRRPEETEAELLARVKTSVKPVNGLITLHVLEQP